VGISGGIDSAISSALCAMTERHTLVLSMPIHQHPSHLSRADEHIQWLKRKYAHVTEETVDLTLPFDAWTSVLSKKPTLNTVEFSEANLRARMRMATLYYYATLHGLLVAGTGNKVEDFGIGFFTKYGDGGVDISPIADLTKTEVYAVAAELGIVHSIREALPSDGLFGDARSDEDQIGASYPELEWAMEFMERFDLGDDPIEFNRQLDMLPLTARQKEVAGIYFRMNRRNRHKMIPIPVCEIPAELKQ
jgi:NAD+ synthase